MKLKIYWFIVNCFLLLMFSIFFKNTNSTELGAVFVICMIVTGIRVIDCGSNIVKHLDE